MLYWRARHVESHAEDEQTRLGSGAAAKKEAVAVMSTAIVVKGTASYSGGNKNGNYIRDGDGDGDGF